jgi:hypothetical protein
MPYTGFGMPLLLLTGTGALFSTFYLTRGCKCDGEVADVVAELPAPPQGWNLVKALIPFVVLLVAILGARVIPAYWPVIGMPMIFGFSALAVILVSPKKVNLMEIGLTTVNNLKELVGIMVMVGILNQILTLTGARGLVSLGVVILPIWLLFGALWIILPVSEGVLQYAVAPLFGVPLIMLFNMLGYNPVIALSCWAVMWPVGDCLPPTAVVGKASVMQMNYKGDYTKGFLKNVLVPGLVVLAICTIVMIFNKPIGSFLGV